MWAVPCFTSSQVPADQGLSKDHLATAQHAAPACVRGGTSSSWKQGWKNKQGMNGKTVPRGRGMDGQQVHQETRQGMRTSLAHTPKSEN